MIVFKQRGEGRERGQQPASHLFRVGQTVRMTSRFGISPNTPDFYRVTATLPPRDNSPQYRIRSDEERHERVVTEDTLEAADSPTSGAGANLIERTFGHGQGTKTQQPRDTEAEAGKGYPTT